MSEMAEMNQLPHLVRVDAVTRRFPLDHNFVSALDNVSLCVEPGNFWLLPDPAEAANRRCST